MLFELDADQQAVTDAVERILDRHAGPARIRSLGGDQPRYDHELVGVLRDQGFLGFRFGEGAGPLEAALVDRGGRPARAALRPSALRR